MTPKHELSALSMYAQKGLLLHELLLRNSRKAGEPTLFRRHGYETQSSKLYECKETGALTAAPYEG